MLPDGTGTLRVLFLAGLALSVMAGPADAAEQAAQMDRPAAQAAYQPPLRAPGSRAATAPPVVPQDENASATRQELEGLLSRYPPSVGRVLKLDPSLLGSQSYLAPYPALAAFLAQHPEVVRNPAYFLANVRGVSEPSPAAYPAAAWEAQTISMWRNMMQGVVILLVFVIVTAALTWLVKSLIDYRRWRSLSKAQLEVHNKVLDRFAAKEDLLAFIQTPAGQRFLESAPISLDALTPAIGAPLKRILWAVEAGLVLAAGGAGLLFVSNRVAVEVSQPLYVLGVLAVSLGTGFVVSAIVSFVLSKHLGLLERHRAADSSRGTPSGV